ncbi:YcbX family protein [Psychromonas antarctica]|uniref:YcbX family protein n=1 Tax=Psychromonas antarctica TaxID=67573 RepID=UPI001EE7FDDE|nr:MOSC N-terminal beta barrel domain-containing protein [Psychromonas antarctica]MCG6200081.1 MOSC domain-containing protein [Psychromonas antarctica]
MQILNDIYIYPIKSIKAINQPAAYVEEKGLRFDRRYMLVDLQGEFITGRTHPQLTQITVQFSRKLLLVDAPNMPTLSIDPEQFSTSMQTSQVWSDTVEVLHCHDDYDQWFSNYLQYPCQLVFFSDETKRLLKNRKTQVSFADGYPLLLINQTSVDFLNARLEKPVTPLHFRPNIVVQGDFPFIEDSWARIKIGEVEFEVSKPCSRCLFTNVDPQTGVADNDQPLKTLATFRYHQGNIDFGQNLIPLNSGIIRTGDEIKIISTQGARFYSEKQEQQASNKKNIEIYYQGADITTTGDNQQLLLDQAEQAGIDIPYSCRGGQCGRCKVKLIEGEVTTLNDEGLSDQEKQQGYILSCSCIPLSDIIINH